MATHYLGPEIEDDFDDQFDDDKYDDDMPLVMLKGVKEEDKVKRKRKKPNTIVTPENKKEEKRTEKKSGKQKKQLKEGFSSRMVQETNEYEVLEEMAAKSKSDKYLRCVYKCEKCVKGFNFKDVIDNHMKKHSQESGTLKCEICAQYCPSAVSMRGHMKSHTTRYKCKICGAIRISRQHLLEHYSIEHTFDANTYTCEQCSFTTKKRTVIQRHVKTHKVGKNLTCSVCGAGFNNMHALRMHVSRHDPAQRFNCPQCNMKFIYPSLLHRHMLSHSHRDHYCVECDVTFKSLRHMLSHSHRDHYCVECDVTFKSLRHMLSHSHRDHYCVECDVTFKSLRHMLSHSHRDHYCVECDVTFKSLKGPQFARTELTQNGLVMTPASVDTMEWLLACDFGVLGGHKIVLKMMVAVCVTEDPEIALQYLCRQNWDKPELEIGNWSYVDKRDDSYLFLVPFKVYKNWGDVEKRLFYKDVTVKAEYKCSQCDERFISPPSVLAHLSATHGAAKSHACALCGKLYSSRESARSHERRAHATEKLACGVCNKDFSVSISGRVSSPPPPSVLAHLSATHGAAKSHACALCGKLYSSRESARSHERRAHATEKLACGVCNKDFSREYKWPRFIPPPPPSVLAHLSATHGAAKSHACALCGKLYSSRESARSHERRAHATEKLACGVCNKDFSVSISGRVSSPPPPSVLAHLSATHGAAKSHACALCGKLYSSRESARSHERRAHATEKLACGVCNKDFSRKYMLAKHQRAHASLCCGFESPDKKVYLA
ncbi:zinc finger protein 91-like [Cydia amplana]|uniref:zinc finger protein 91-like n=1 Tax=Cydia amplana TaxID=1869771 RepID=UPI002FE668C4